MSRSRVASNAVHFVREASIHAVAYGPKPISNHSDFECVEVDVRGLEENLSSMEKVTRDAGIAHRPHTKTDKTRGVATSSSPELARRAIVITNAILESNARVDITELKEK